MQRLRERPHAASRLRLGDPGVAVPLAAALTTLAVALVVVRHVRTGSGGYDFLAWNLFLAWLPFAFAAATLRLRRGRRTRAAAIPAGLLWLAFFPNAPYIVTDYVHIGFEGTRHLALDLTMLTAAAAAGMVLAIGSLRLVHDVVRRRLGDAAGWGFVGAVATASAIGVYLGRVQRWNSWQLFSHPGQVARDVLTRVTDPQAHGRAVGGTIVFALAFLLSYLVAGTGRTRHGLPKSDPDA